MMFRKYSEHERYLTITKLFTSTSLLWSTPWVDQLSIFNLQRHQTLNAEARISMWPDPRNEVRTAHFGSMEDNGNPQRATLNRFTRLGLVICDIALCFPITVDIAYGGLVFSYRVKEIGKDLTSQCVWRNWVSASVLVRDVDRSMPGLWGAEVLSALSLGIRTRPAATGYLDACATLDSDQKRLERFYQEFLKQRESQKPRKWMRSLGAKHDAMLLSVTRQPSSPLGHDNGDTLPVGFEQQQDGGLDLRRKAAENDLRGLKSVGEV